MREANGKEAELKGNVDVLGLEARSSVAMESLGEHGAWESFEGFVLGKEKQLLVASSNIEVLELIGGSGERITKMSMVSEGFEEYVPSCEVEVEKKGLQVVLMEQRIESIRWLAAK